MKKLIAIILCLLIIACLMACESTVELHCDGEGCQNTVSVTGEADESRVVFCKECSDSLLADN